MIGPELPGEDFSGIARKSEHEQKRRPGRPREIDPESLSRTVNDLQFVLEQNWGVVGWLLREAKSISDVRDAFAKIVHQRCENLEPFRDDRTRNITSRELRVLRKKVAELKERHSRDYAQRQSVQGAFDQASQARSTASDPVKQVQIEAILLDLGCKSQEAESLEQKRRMELGSHRTQLKECEAYYAQTEILGFLESNRRQFTPKNVACAMAGLPRVTARVSSEQCAKYGINPSHGMAFEMFQTIERMVPEPIHDLTHSIDSLREYLLNGPHTVLAHAVQLRKNWYFLESAIRSSARDTHAQHGSLAFRIFADYSRTSTSHSAVEAVLAQANRLHKDDEDPELERSPCWGPSR